MDAGGTGDCLAQPTPVEMGWGIARGRDGGWTAVVEWGSETRHLTDPGPVGSRTTFGQNEVFGPFFLVHRVRTEGFQPNPCQGVHGGDLMEIDSVLKRALKILEISTICTSGARPSGVRSAPREKR